MSTDDPNPSDLPPAVRETLDSLGGALGDIAELDKEQLNETIGLLETLGHDQAAGILRSRREVLKGAGAATGLGIAGLAGATATGGARAQSDTQTGTIGNGNQDADLQDVSAELVNTDELSNIRIVGPDGFDSLQAAHDDLPSGGGQILLTKSVSETAVEFTKKVHLVGVQAQTDPFDGNDADGPFIAASGGDGLWFKRAGTLRDVTIVGGGGTGTNYNLRLGESGVSNPSMTVDNVAVWNASGDNVQVRGGCQQWSLDFAEIRSAGQDNFRVQTDLEAGDYFNGNDVVLRHTAQAGRDGIRLAGPCSGNDWFIVSESNDGYGVRVPSSTKFTGNHFTGYGVEANGSGGFDFSGAPADARSNTLDVFFAQSNTDPYNERIFSRINIGAWPTVWASSNVKIRKSADQTVTTGSSNTVEWPSAFRDNLGEFNSTNNAFVPEHTSTYHITTNIGLEASSDQNRVDVRFVVDGTTQTEKLCILNGSGFQSVSLSDDLIVAAGEQLTVEIEPAQADDTIIGNGLRTNFAVHDAR